jgi:diacylglycerol kinase family enzyme
VFVNPVAPNADLPRLRAALDREFGEGAHRIVETQPRKDFAADVVRELDRAAAAGCDLVLAAGGDGTISLVAEAVHRAAKALVVAIVPCGTANVLARELKIPGGIEDAVALAAARPAVVPLDALTLGDRLFLTQVSVGLNATMIRDTTRENQQRYKRLSYLATLMRGVAAHGARLFRLQVDGRRFTVRAWEIVVANASTLGARPLDWGPNVDPTDGVVNVCVFHVHRRRDLLGLAWMALFGWQRKNPHARFFPVAKEVEIACAQSVPVQGDGESLGTTPVRLGIAAAAVQVTVPAPVAEAVRAEPTHLAEETAQAATTPSSQSAPPAKPVDASVPAPGPGPTLENEPRAEPTPSVLSRWARERKRVGAIDTAAYLAINRWNGGPLVDRLMLAISRSLNWGELWIAITLVAAVSAPPRFGKLPLLVIPPLWLAMLTVNYPIKSLFRRQRPFLLHERARMLGRRPRDSSFPSGPYRRGICRRDAAVGAPARSGTGVLRMPRQLVACSRVYLGVHFPADVLVGGIVGSLLGVLYGWLWAIVVSWF